MKIIIKILIGVLALVLVGVGGLYLTGNGMLLTIFWATTMGGPSLPFDETEAVEPPSYSDPDNWAALPSRVGAEDMIPKGIGDGDIQGSAPVDVFFVHPTGFLRGKSWTYSMDKNSATEENTQWMMANQASPFNGCCNVYAPRYRQANIFSYFQEEEVRDQLLGFAYQDVRRAFEYFIANFSEGKPFILASHSQGTHHSSRLLQELIDGTELSQRMVAAYIIGGTIQRKIFDDMKTVTLCDSPTDLHCAIHWDTWSEDVIDTEMPGVAENVCTNPLSWRLNGGLTEKSSHLGAVVASGVFQVELSGSDVATGVAFDPLGSPIKNMLRAQCKDGALYISDQTGTPFGEQGGSFGGGNYHGLDYPVFHMDIRENAKERVQEYLNRSG